MKENKANAKALKRKTSKPAVKKMAPVAKKVVARKAVARKVVARKDVLAVAVAADGVMTVTGPLGAVRLRYAERSREVEAVAPDEGEVGEEAMEAYENMHDRVVGDLEAQLPRAIGEARAGQFGRLAEVFSRDSYDGSHGLVLESGTVSAPLEEAVLEALGENTSLVTLLRAIAGHTAYPEGMLLLARKDETDGVHREEVVRLSAQEAPHRGHAHGHGDPDAELAAITALMEEGVRRGEAITSLEDSPHLREALARLESLEKAPGAAARAFTLHGDWLVRCEPEWRTVVNDAVLAYSRGFEASPDDLGVLEKLALAEQRAGAQARAITHIDVLLRARPDDPRLLFLRALSSAELAREKAGEDPSGLHRALTREAWLRAQAR